MDFKVGQIVELVDDRDMAADKGATAVVTGIGSRYVDVEWKTLANDQMDGGYSPRVFKLIPQKGKQLLFSFME